MTRTLFDPTCSKKFRCPSRSKSEGLYLDIARDELNDLRFHAVGQTVPDVSGIDLDGQPIRLSDFRGRAVLLSFWGTWCFPCMKLVPHEKELVEIHRGKPFEIVGINCDDDIAKAKAAALRTEMTWRSIRNQSGGRPLYHEFPNVGHDDCAERVYAMADLFEWLATQKRNGN